MAKLINGKEVSLAVQERIRKETEALKEKGITPGLAVVIVGDDPASRTYVNNKKKACERVGFHSEEYALPATTTQEELLALVKELNQRPEINGILVQSPLPKGLDEKMIVENIDPNKDVDAFHAVNVGKIMIGDFSFLPCTPAGVIELLDYEGIDIAGKECVVLGRSNIVGKPMAALLLKNNATVTICHSKTEDLASYTRRADVVIVATGRRHTLTADMVKEGAVVVDVGMNRNEQGKLCGDVDYEEVKEKASFITPVPGGVGPMTITELLENTIQAAQRHHRAEK